MPITLNTITQGYTFFSGETAAGATSNYLFRGYYTEHMIQASTSGPTPQTFVVYASTDGNVWTAIRDQSDVDATVGGYTGANANGVINLSGCYPYLCMVTGNGSTGPFTASIYSTNRTIT